MPHTWTLFSPVDHQAAVLPAFGALARRLKKAASLQHDEAAADATAVVVRDFVRSPANNERDDLARLEAAGLVLADLAANGWAIRVKQGLVEISPPTELQDPMEEKTRIRQQELLRRREQLSAPPVRRFIAEMETSRLLGDRFVSIFSLMRDGASLAADLRALQSAGRLAEELPSLIQPYLQVLEAPDDRCAHTGLRLHDVWRYFRYTWATQVNSVPGRTMRFLVRDGAVQDHPVIGIGALSSPVLGLKNRDVEVGWDPDAFLKRVAASRDPRYMTWARDRIRRRLAEIYLDDLMNEGLLSEKDLLEPDGTVVARLDAEAEIAQRTHYHHGFRREFKRQGAGRDGLRAPDWRQRAQLPLFRAKRCRELARLLAARRSLHALDELEPSDALAALVASEEGRRTIRFLIRLEKSEKIGIAVADLSVCGAVPPYSALVGGKLVGALAASPEIIGAYERRYSNTPSEIASAVAGRPIVRDSRLVLLGTTSLFGAHSSQYNRLKVPCDRIGGRPGESIFFQPCGHTESFGTSQFSLRSTEALVRVLRLRDGGLRVNSLFGEGASPKLRKLREGLDALGLDSQLLLRHTRKRALYIIPLARNFRDYLTGSAETPDYLLPSVDSASVTGAIAQWWISRWAVPRASSGLVLAEMASHTLTRPVRHGARVPLEHVAGDPAQFMLDGIETAMSRS